MDLTEIEGVYERNLAGYPPYHPRMMVKVLFYGYCTGVFSSRKIARKLEEDVAFRVLAAENRPDFRTISDFRKLHLAALKKLFVEVLTLCRKARLESEIADLLSTAQRVDEEEDAKYGSDVRGDELPEELRFREGRLAKIRQAMAELESEAQEVAKQEASVSDGSDEELEPKKRNRPKKPPSGVPDDKAQKNFTDPESRIMLSADKSFIAGYNAQAAVDSEYQVVVAAMVTNQAADSVHVETMIERIEENVGQLPAERYGLRKETVEPVFGQIKRCMGFRQFSMRGQDACEAEWSLVCAAHNLLKLFRYGASAMAKQAQEYTAAGQRSDALAVAA